MCNHVYKLKYNDPLMGTQCPYPTIYSALKNANVYSFKNIDFNLELPLDKDGVCLFHSNKLTWKSQNNFTKKFVELLKLLDIYNYQDYYNFAEFIFVGESPKTGKDLNKGIFNLTNCTFKKRAKFIGAIFTDTVIFVDVRFERGATFQESIFNNQVKLRNVYFWGGEFEKTVFKNLAFFENVEFLNAYTDFSNTEFNNSVFFVNSNFDDTTDFSNAIFSSGENGQATAKFENVSFNGSTNFSQSVFDSSVEFEKIKINSAMEFIDTSFNNTKSAIRYYAAAINFTKVEINEGGSLVFESTDPKNRMFKQEVNFSFEGDIKGSLRFENVNFNRITDDSRREIIRLSKIGKAEIGSGCIKYCCQTKIRTLEIGHNNQSLVLELTQTFLNYFTAKHGSNLGIEIIERDEKKISFFYFTDENIAEEEFLKRLTETGQDLWGLLSTKSTEPYALTDEKEETNLLLEKKNKIINAVDGISALVSTFFRVGVRIAYGKWFQDDTEALINAIKFDNKKTKFTGEELHQSLLGNYTVQTLIKIIQTQNLTIEYINKYGNNVNNYTIDTYIERASYSEIKQTKLIGELNMADKHVGDNYTVSQAGAVGPNSRAHNMTFNQIWNQVQKSVDLEVLSSELSKLRQEMRKQAVDREHDLAIASVAEAEEYAKAGEGSKTLEHLKAAGKWALDTATNIGSTIAAEAIKKSMGM